MPIVSLGEPLSRNELELLRKILEIKRASLEELSKLLNMPLSSLASLTELLKNRGIIKTTEVEIVYAKTTSEGMEYLEAVLIQEHIKPSEQSNIVELVKQVLIRLNKDGSNRETQEQKYFAIYEGFKYYQEGVMPKGLPTFDSIELRKVPKAIPYL